MTAPTRVETPRWTGQNYPRKEDRRLLTGQGRYVDDRGMIRQGYAHFVRSPYAHARIVSIDTSKLENMTGVYCTLVGEEVKEMSDPLFQIAPPPGGNMVEYLMAVDKVRYQGEPVAVVLAETRELARDAADLIDVRYEPLPPVVDAIAAQEPDAPILHDEVGTNVSWQGTYEYGDIDWALAEADHVVKIDKLHFHRFSSTPIECFGVVVNWDRGTDTIEVISNNQMPMFGAMMIAPSLRIGIDRFEFTSQDIGGGFGIKINLYKQTGVLALLSRKAGRPVKWTETRTEHHLDGGHGNERWFLDVEVPVMADGTILGVKARAIDDAGAYLHYEPLGAVIWSQVLPGCYKMRHFRIDYSQSLTNKCPTVPNRGYSRMQHLWMLERIIDIVAHELGFDPVEIRKRNYVQPDDYPYETPNGCVYDSGNLPLSLDKALELIDYPKWRERQKAAEGTTKRIGIGIGSTLDSGTNNFGQSRIINRELPFSGNGEAAICKLDLYGEVSVALGTTPQGQGHETTAAQVVADILGISPEEVTVIPGFDQARNSYVGFSGTYASQFAVTGINAVIGAAEKLKAEMVELAAMALGASEDEIELAEGHARVVGDPERAIPFIGLANMIYTNNAELPTEVAERISLNCRHVYVPPFDPPDPDRKYGNLTLTYASQIHAAVVEVDTETGKVEVLDYAAVDDCGVRINPQIVEGQVHGAAAHGIAAALREEMRYDEDGQLLNANFLYYHAPSAAEMPHIKTDYVESPSPFTGTGAKGMGEGGGAPLHAICSAIQDALGSDVPVVADSFNPPERVYRLLHGEGLGAGRGVEVVSKEGS